MNAQRIGRLGEAFACVLVLLAAEVTCRWVLNLSLIVEPLLLVGQRLLAAAWGNS